MSDFLIPPLVQGPKNSLTPLFDKLVAEIFKRFDKDCDGALNPEELDEFATVTNGEPFDKEGLKNVYAHIELNDKGFITMKGFKQMYGCQCVADPDETWKDFAKHGFSKEYVMKCVMNKKPIIPSSASAHSKKSRRNKK